MAKVENLTVQYGGTAVLENFSAEFPDGGVTAVSGRSGCGKTTLLAVLLGLLRPDGGTVSGFRQPSAVFQEDRLLPFLSAEKNIAVTAGCTEAEAGEALLSVGFDAADRGKRAFELSGGMARRVAIVRAMLAPGDAVLLDEPFKGLDERTRAQVVRFVCENRRGRTMVVVTHDPRDAEALHAAHTVQMGGQPAQTDKHA
ncbi:ATP-binding cassette domain-containing protein [Hominenteromicrobium sp.]